jgi:HEAT repeat protein
MPDQETQTGGPDPVQETSESEISKEERLAHFIRMLSDDDEKSRWKAAEALGRIRDPGAVEPLIDTLWDDDSRVRLKAAWALGQIGDIRAIPPLRRLYRMEKEGVQEIITEAIEEINFRMSRQ